MTEAKYTLSDFDEMEVEIKDRKKEVEYLRMACNIAQIGINYRQADLILRLQEKLEKVKGNFSLSDGAKIYSEWNKDWQKYFEEKSICECNGDPSCRMQDNKWLCDSCDKEIKQTM